MQNRPDFLSPMSAMAQDRMAEVITRPTVAEYVAQAALIYGVSTEQILGARGSYTVSRARHWVMYHARRWGRCSLPEIGRRLGGRDHSTVVYGIRTHAARHGLDAIVVAAPNGTKIFPPYEGPEPTLDQPFSMAGRCALRQARREVAG